MPKQVFCSGCHRNIILCACKHPQPVSMGSDSMSTVVEIGAQQEEHVAFPASVPLTEEVVRFKSGASRSEHKPAYHLCSPHAYRAWAVRMGEGATKHGAFNWLQGADDPAWQLESLNHLLDHVMLAVQGDTSDDHWAAVMCTAAFFRHFQEVKKLQLTTPYGE